jgi:hypothetical protein
MLFEQKSQINEENYSTFETDGGIIQVFSTRKLRFLVENFINKAETIKKS